MKQIYTLLSIFLLGIPALLNAQGHFSFRPDGTFIIAHFSDTHWDQNATDDCLRTEKTLKMVIEQEHPDLIIFNGDIVTEKPAHEGWQSIIRIMNQEKVPFVVNMGNHDPEIASRKYIYTWLSASPYYRGIVAPDTDESMDKILIPVYGSRDSTQVQALIYCIDSGDYYPDQFVSHYDWIRFHQIAWYRAESRKYTELNGGVPIPSVMFFHIPLPEFEEIAKDPKSYHESKSYEGVSSATINSGLLSSILEMKDVMCVMCGHDHNNDLIGQYRGVSLAYGRVSGWSAYGDLVRGARIMRLYEGHRKFDSWITTPESQGETYYYPSGINSLEEDTMTYLPSFKRGVREHGVEYTYHEGLFKKVSDLSPDNVVKRGTMPYFSILNATQKDHFGYEFRAIVNIPERGVYQFYTYSDDGSILMIDGRMVVDNDGGHSARRRDGRVALEAGLHEMKVLYYDDYMGETLKIGVSSRQVEERELPADWLFIP